MTNKNNFLISSLKKQIEDLTQDLEIDVEEIRFSDSENNIDKLKSKKILSETILKITSIMMQLSKLQDLEEEADPNSQEHDTAIINNFLKKKSNSG